MSSEQDNEEEVIALCVGCGTTQSEAQAMRDPFLAAGHNGVCKFCGGPVIVVLASEKDHIMERRNRGEII